MRFRKIKKGRIVQVGTIYRDDRGHYHVSDWDFDMEGTNYLMYADEQGWNGWKWSELEELAALRSEIEEGSK